MGSGRCTWNKKCTNCQAFDGVHGPGNPCRECGHLFDVHGDPEPQHTKKNKKPSSSKKPAESASESDDGDGVSRSSPPGPSDSEDDPVGTFLSTKSMQLKPLAFSKLGKEGKALLATAEVNAGLSSGRASAISSSKKKKNPKGLVAQLDAAYTGLQKEKEASKKKGKGKGKKTAMDHSDGEVDQKQQKIKQAIFLTTSYKYQAKKKDWALPKGARQKRHATAGLICKSPAPVSGVWTEDQVDKYVRRHFAPVVAYQEERAEKDTLSTGMPLWGLMGRNGTGRGSYFEHIPGTIDGSDLVEHRVGKKAENVLVFDPLTAGDLMQADVAPLYTIPEAMVQKWHDQVKGTCEEEDSEGEGEDDAEAEGDEPVVYEVDDDDDDEPKLVIKQEPGLHIPKKRSANMALAGEKRVTRSAKRAKKSESPEIVEVHPPAPPAPAPPAPVPPAPAPPVPAPAHASQPDPFAGINEHLVIDIESTEYFAPSTSTSAAPSVPSTSAAPSVPSTSAVPSAPSTSATPSAPPTIYSFPPFHVLCCKLLEKGLSYYYPQCLET
ncbi:hypothetical protein EXIGLDRAFT_696624 [Exidia glandulosa HHB12029]|uniref:Uncharacterized protein n=1 Tax=Exidia glandulosa HHB12029 TaxID=1314781 RepID=A0A165F7J8_EXIGL|nr:hypothetical protein EXIGLDRAFT_696624 [Exidia glandulosa HHB12029]